MKKSGVLAVAAAATLLFISPAARADMANGSYFNDFSGTVPVWDISGEYSGGLGLGLGLDFTITQDPSGNFVGDGTFDFEDGGNSLSGDVSVSGKVSGSRVTMDILISGGGTVLVDQFGDTDDVDFAAGVKTTFGIDGNDGQLVVTSGSAKVIEQDLTTGKKKSRSGSLEKGALMALPDDTTGDWNLTLNLTPNGTKYTGTATVETSTGGTEELTATGTYSAKTDTSKITLKGADGSLSLVISTSGSDITIQSAKGKLFGQSVNIKAP